MTCPFPQQDRDVLIAALQQDGDAMGHVSPVCHEDPEFVMDYMQQVSLEQSKRSAINCSWAKLHDGLLEAVITTSKWRASTRVWGKRPTKEEGRNELAKAIVNVIKYFELDQEAQDASARVESTLEDNGGHSRMKAQPQGV